MTTVATTHGEIVHQLMSNKTLENLNVEGFKVNKAIIRDQYGEIVKNQELAFPLLEITTTKLESILFNLGISERFDKALTELKGGKSDEIVLEVLGLWKEIEIPLHMLYIIAKSSQNTRSDEMSATVREISDLSNPKRMKRVWSADEPLTLSDLERTYHERIKKFNSLSDAEKNIYVSSVIFKEMGHVIEEQHRRGFRKIITKHVNTAGARNKAVEADKIFEELNILETMSPVVKPI